MFSYRALFGQAWEIAWKHKYLWFFGLFASILAGGGSWEYQILTQNLNQGLVDGSYLRLSSILAIGELAKNFFFGLADLFQQNILVILSTLSLLLMTIFILVFFLWLAVASQAALIHSVKKILDIKKKESTLTIRHGLTAGHSYFWTVLGLNLFIKILVGFALFIAGLPLLLMAIQDTTILAVVFTVFFVIFVPIALSLSLLVKYAIAYKVIDDKSFISALEDGGRLFKKHWLVSVEAAVILFIINFLASLLMVSVLTIFLLPLLLLGLMFQLNWLVTLILLVAIALIIVFGSLMTTFQTAAWTNLFIRLKEKGGRAKLERVFNR